MHVWEMIGGNLQERRGVGKTMNLVEDDSPAAMPPQKGLGVIGVPTDARQIAVEVIDSGERPNERGLAEPAWPRQPDDSPLPPIPFDSIPPIRPVDGIAPLLDHRLLLKAR